MKLPLARLVWILLMTTGLTALAQQPAPDTPCEWSNVVNGLTGRICLSRKSVFDGSPLLAATLTLRSGESPTMSVAWQISAMSYSIVDASGANVTTGINVDGQPGGSIMSGKLPPLIVPQRGEVSFEIIGAGGVARDKAAVLQLGTFETIFAFEPTDRPLFLRAVLEIQRSASPVRGEWSGRIVLPDVRIPLGMESVSPAKFAATLVEAEALIATAQPDKALTAVASLSRLDDLRTVPLYMKAFAIPDYSVKGRIINNLGALLRHFPNGDLDELMAGLTQASKTDPSVRNAALLRQGVVHALGASKRPDARKLLTVMASDADEGVRNLANRYLTEP